ncbi:hypothetical protein D3C81_1138110 [compost metagenome]
MLLSKLDSKEALISSGPPLTAPPYGNRGKACAGPCGTGSAGGAEASTVSAATARSKAAARAAGGRPYMGLPAGSAWYCGMAAPPLSTLAQQLR